MDASVVKNSEMFDWNSLFRSLQDKCQKSGHWNILPLSPDKTSDIGEIVHKVRNDREECCNLLIPWHHFQEVSDVHML